MSATLKSTRFWGVFALGAGVLLAVENTQQLAQSLVNAKSTYRRVVTTGVWAYYPRHTVIVEIRGGREPYEVSLLNVCEQRSFLARLLEQLKSARPSAIVFDKFFMENVCIGNRAGTDKLLTTVQTLLNDRIPVVVATVANDRNELLDGLAFPAGTDSGTTVLEGSALLDVDIRKAPLIWRHFRNRDGQAESRYSLSLVAANARNPQLLKSDRRLQSFLTRDELPLVSFMSEDAFEGYTLSAIELVCGEPATSVDWRECKHNPTQRLDEFKGRVFLIGESTMNYDLQDTVVGRRSGVWLQANYTEAISQGQLFRQTPFMLSLALSLVLFASVEFALHHPQRVWRLPLAIVTVFLAYSISFLLLRVTGYYVDPALGVVAAIASSFGRLADWVRARTIARERAA